MFRITYRVSRFPKRVSETCQADKSPPSRRALAAVRLTFSATQRPVTRCGGAGAILGGLPRNPEVFCPRTLRRMLSWRVPLDYPVWLYDSSYEELAQRHLPVTTGSTPSRATATANPGA